MLHLLSMPEKKCFRRQAKHGRMLVSSFPRHHAAFRSSCVRVDRATLAAVGVNPRGGDHNRSSLFSTSAVTDAKGERSTRSCSRLLPMRLKFGTFACGVFAFSISGGSFKNFSHTSYKSAEQKRTNPPADTTQPGARRCFESVCWALLK